MADETPRPWEVSAVAYLGFAYAISAFTGFIRARLPLAESDIIVCAFFALLVLGGAAFLCISLLRTNKWAHGFFVIVSLYFGVGALLVVVYSLLYILMKGTDFLVASEYYQSILLMALSSMFYAWVPLYLLTKPKIKSWFGVAPDRWGEF